jgi:hypothetical protein
MHSSRDRAVVALRCTGDYSEHGTIAKLDPTFDGESLLSGPVLIRSAARTCRPFSAERSSRFQGKGVWLSPSPVK